MKGWRILLMPVLMFGLSVCLALTGCEGGGGDDDDDAPAGGGAAGGVTEEADEAEEPEAAEPEPEPEAEPELGSVTLISPDNGAVFTARGGQATVSLFWSTAPGADSYAVTVGGQKHETGANTSYEFTAPPGIYSWSVFAIAHREDYSGWDERISEEERQFTIAAF